MSEMILFLCAIGIAFGAGVFMGWIWRRPIQARIVVDRELARTIDRGLVEGWLDAHGLTWMPKGPEFTVQKKDHS
ncbi:MAG: hypothetical protein HYU77_13760 [Betaproteobacteria bacterium]|nr:hypothetical protein [Betaproteobacteria bacterium]